MLKKTLLLSAMLVVVVFALNSGKPGHDEKPGIPLTPEKAMEMWMESGHGHETAEAFVHWDEDGEISTSCARCHSATGFVEHITFGATQNAQPISPRGIRCIACHEGGEEGGPPRDHTSVTFPSGITVEGLGPEALCMECHQGRQSKRDVDSRIAGASLPDDDTPSSSLSFRNIHYYPAAAIQMGTVVDGGYQYDDKSYDARFSHVDGFNACHTCHNPHSLEIRLGQCNTCHTWTMPSSGMSFFNGIKDPKNIRFFGSFMDYDGDGDMQEGMYYEIEDIKAKLYFAIQEYCRWIGFPIVYNAEAYPYWFHDANNNGVVDADDTSRYDKFTARTLKASFNYQAAKKDPNAYAHGGKYVIQLLYDSIEDLNEPLPNPVSLAGMHRGDEGHFDGSKEAWRHWDEDGAVSTSCAKCHSATGLAILLAEGSIEEEQPLSNGMLCTTCHTSPPNLIAGATAPVEFPSGLVEDLGDASNLCMNCHQGRASMATVDARIRGNPGGPHNFINIHYYPTAAVLFGSDVKGGYEFPGKNYNGQNLFPNHNGRFDTCIECHMSSKGLFPEAARPHHKHNVEKPLQSDCVYCHGQDPSEPSPGADPTKFKFSGIRPGNIPDFDGDGNMEESLQNEIRGLEAALYNQILVYSANVLNIPAYYDSHRYPYFFVDTNGNGIGDPGETTRFTFFDDALLRAAYNYQMSLKEPHGFIHNPFYVAQLLVDSIEHIGGNVSAYTWR